MLRCRAIYAWRLPLPERTSIQRITIRTDVPRIAKTCSAYQVAGAHATEFRGIRGGGHCHNRGADLVVGDAPRRGSSSRRRAAALSLNPFPFADINRIVWLDMTDKGRPRGLSVTVRQLVALQQSDVLDGAFASNGWARRGGP
jgi:hypothetical protein